MTAVMKRRFAALASVLALCFLLLFAGVAAAHPVAQGAMEVFVEDTRVEIALRVSLEEVFVSNALLQGQEEQDLQSLYASHGQYVLRHLFVRASGARLLGSLTETIPPGVAVRVGTRELPASPTLVTYRMMFEPPERGSSIARDGNLVTLDFTQDILNEFEYAPGNPWEATFVTRIEYRGGAPFEGSLFTSKEPLIYGADLAETTTAENPAPLRAHSLELEYLDHGMWHILLGYDHLMFAAALVLTATTLWQLALVVSAFTLAHTLTLVLSVLDLVSMPSAIVEPLIAASIVVVALQNVIAPRSTTGYSRLFMAFAFGLFHGLGFAGGLRDAMQGLGLTDLGWAVASFSLGVEIGHQILVLPLFGVLILMRSVSTARFPLYRHIVRFASVVIGSAGLLFLRSALA